MNFMKSPLRLFLSGPTFLSSSDFQREHNDVDEIEAINMKGPDEC